MEKPILAVTDPAIVLLKNTVRRQFNELTALLLDCYVGIITPERQSLQGG